MSKLEELSKEISYALRHAPWEYDLEMDEDGWVPIEQLLEALNRKENWINIVENDLKVMIDSAKKKRYEMDNGRIRAFYGHSIPMKVLKEEKMPPDILYHGTARRFYESIRKNGLLPQSRQYVHLSQDIETAKKIGKRHDNMPCLLVIDAKRAWKDGIKFYVGNENVWLADIVPIKYIKQMS